jgi:crotonobetainyl-CoA:carnitine CoA-transferase CaiB-like acyl-CoA transferase
MLAPLYNGVDLWEDRNFHERGLWTEVDHPDLGALPMLGRPYIFEDTPWRIRSAAPRLGEHTESVLVEAGLSTDRIEALRRQAVVA